MDEILNAAHHLSRQPEVSAQMTAHRRAIHFQRLGNARNGSTFELPGFVVREKFFESHAIRVDVAQRNASSQ